MKKSFVFIIGIVLFFSCKYPQQKSTITSSKNIIKHIKPGKHCYTAVFEKDSASLTFTINTTGSINGQLNIHYNSDDTAAVHQSTNGKITGEFRGDTLFADYYFTSGAKMKDNYINPIALLFKSDTLIMGHGQIYYYLGRTYFDDKIPISFTKSRFRFIPSNCK